MTTARTRRPFWRRSGFWFFGFVALTVLLLAHRLWNPGLFVRDGRDDLSRNALWIGHGWLGDDLWFGSDSAKKARFRAPATIDALAQKCRDNGIRDLYPHLTPTLNDGAMIGWDDAQIERFLDHTNGLRVMPWVGGRMGTHIVPSDEARTARFVKSVGELLKKHPRLAGVHLNVEPWKSGDEGMLRLLEGLRAAMPPDKILSLAAYTPNTGLEPFKITWDKSYTRQVAARCDQMVWMLYDTSLHDAKLYQWFYARWTRTILDWTQNADPPEVLFGVPTYGAAGPTLGPLYHNPKVENLSNALSGLHRALSEARDWPGNYLKLPRNYRGAAIYCEWETDDSEWETWHREWRRE